MACDADIMRAIGQLEGKVETLCANNAEQTEEIRGLRTQVGKLDRAQARSGAVSGGVVAVGVSIMAATINHWLRGNGP